MEPRLDPASARSLELGGEKRPERSQLAWVGVCQAAFEKLDVCMGMLCVRAIPDSAPGPPPLQSVCQAIVALLSDSAPDSPLNCDAGNLLRAGDVRGFASMARMYTIEYAMQR